MLKRFALGSLFLPATFFSNKIRCAEDEDVSTPVTENVEDPVDTVLKKRPPATPEEIRGQLSTPASDT